MNNEPTFIVVDFNESAIEHPPAKSPVHVLCSIAGHAHRGIIPNQTTHLQRIYFLWVVKIGLRFTRQRIGLVGQQVCFTQNSGFCQPKIN